MRKAFVCKPSSRSLTKEALRSRESANRGSSGDRGWATSNNGRSDRRNAGAADDAGGDGGVDEGAVARGHAGAGVDLDHLQSDGAQAQPARRRLALGPRAWPRRRRHHVPDVRAAQGRVHAAPGRHPLPARRAHPAPHGLLLDVPAEAALVPLRLLPGVAGAPGLVPEGGLRRRVQAQGVPRVPPPLLQGHALLPRLQARVDRGGARGHVGRGAGHRADAVHRGRRPRCPRAGADEGPPGLRQARHRRGGHQPLEPLHRGRARDHAGQGEQRRRPPPRRPAHALHRRGARGRRGVGGAPEGRARLGGGDQGHRRRLRGPARGDAQGRARGGQGRQGLQGGRRGCERRRRDAAQGHVGEAGHARAPAHPRQGRRDPPGHLRERAALAQRGGGARGAARDDDLSRRRRGPQPAPPRAAPRRGPVAPGRRRVGGARQARVRAERPGPRQLPRPAGGRRRAHDPPRRRQRARRGQPPAHAARPQHRRAARARDPRAGPPAPARPPRGRPRRGAHAPRGPAPRGPWRRLRGGAQPQDHQGPQRRL